MKQVSISFVVVVFLASFLASPLWSQTTYPKETDEWLKKSALDLYEPKAYDEKEIYEKAKLEKEVSIYSYSSRVHQFGKTFEQQYPGIKVN